jgi:transposase
VRGGRALTAAAPVRGSGETDAKDALHLAQLLAVGQVTAVAVPDEETEAARDLVRARDDARGELMSTRHRVTHLLLRQGIVYSGGTPWTGMHHNWLRNQRFGRPALQLAYDAALAALAAAEDRRDRLDEAITELAAGSRFTPIVDRLACLRGISTLTGFGLAVEIGDWRRLSPVTIGAYLGLVPGEHSTGENRSQGGVTKTGNGALIAS